MEHFHRDSHCDEKGHTPGVVWLMLQTIFLQLFTNLSFESYNADESHEIGVADSYTYQSQLLAELAAQGKPFGARSSGSHASHHQV